MTKEISNLFKLAVNNFLTKVSKKYEVKMEDLTVFLKDFSFVNEQKQAKRGRRKKSEDDDDEEIKKCIHEFLKGKSLGEMCPNRVSTESKTGNYCKRHIGNEDNNKEKKSKAKAKTVKNNKTKKQQELAETENKVIKKLNDAKPQVVIKRNSHGNYEHPETRLVMDRESKKIMGKQQDDGTVSQLTSEDIDNCKLWKLSYVLPKTLSSDSDNKEEVKEELVKKVDKEVKKSKKEESDDEEDEDSE
jgi:hypothetical protein